MANEFIIKNGFHSKGDSQITGSLSITGISDVSASIAAAGGSTPTLQQVITAGAQANGDVVITGSLVISGSFDAFKLETDNIILGPNANNIQAGADNSVIIGHANVQSAYSGDRNVIVGDNSAIALTSGDENVIIGAESGVQLQANSYNIAIGSNTLNNVRGSGNIALGFRSMQYHDGASGYTQTNNVAIGIYSLRYGRNNSNYNVALGAYSLTGTGNTANQYNIGIGSFAGTNITSGEYNILIGPGIASDLTTQDKQLRIGSGSITTISASLATGDVTFYNTASAPNFSGSFQGDGSNLTGVLLASNNLSDVANAGTSRTNLGVAIGSDVQAQSSVLTSLVEDSAQTLGGAKIFSSALSSSAYKLNNANALSFSGNVLYVGNANDWTTVELGRQTTDEIHVNGILKAEQAITASGAISLPNSAQSVNFLNQSGIHSRTGGSYPGFNIASGNGASNRIWLSDTLGTPLVGAGTGPVTASFTGLGRITGVQTIEPHPNHPLILRGGPTPNDGNDGVRIQSADASNVYIDRFQIESDSTNVDAYFHNINGLGINKTSGFVAELDVTGDINASGDITASKFVGDGSTLSGVGTVDTTGTPANNQIAVFTDSNTLEGTSSFSYDSSTKELLIGASSAGSSDANTVRIQGYNSSNPAMLKLGWNNYGGAALESGFGGNLNIYNFGASATDGGRLILGQAGDTGTNQTNYLWIRGDNADDTAHIYMGANSTTYSSEIGVERQEGTGVNYESDISLRAAAGLSGHKSEYVFSRKGMFQAQDANFTVSGSGQVFINIVTSSISPIQKLTGYDQALVVNGTITASAYQGDGSALSGVGTLTGNGTSTRVPFYNGTTSLATNAAFVYTDGSKRLDLTGISSVGNSPLRLSNLQEDNTESDKGLVIDSSANVVYRTLGTNAYSSTSIPSVANGANNRIATFSGATAFNGESNLTFDGSTLAVTGNQTVSGIGTFTGAISASAGVYVPAGQNVGSLAADWFILGDRPKIKVAQNLAIINGNGEQMAIFGNNFQTVLSGSLTVGGASALGPTSPVLDGRIDAKNDVVAFSTSDKRLKDNITPIDSALDKVSKIQGIEFDWIPTPGVHGNEGHDVGVLAQQVEAVLPEVVTTRDNGYKAVKYEKIVPLLIESIKELKAEIEELKKGK